MNARLLGTVVAASLLAGCAAQMFLRVEKRRLDERVLVFLGGGGNSLVLTHGAEAFVADVKFGGMARQLRHEVEDELSRRVQRLLLTHSHLDHTGGLALYPRAGAVVVHPRTRQRLEAEGAHATFIEVERTLDLQLADETVHIAYLGPGHTDGDLVALLVGRKLLVAGDLVVNGFEPRIDEVAGGNVLALQKTLGRLLMLDFVRVLPGHGDVMSRADVEHLYQYLVAVEALVRAARASGQSVDQTVAALTAGADLAPYDDLQPMPLGGTSREKTIRMMYRALDPAQERQ